MNPRFLRHFLIAAGMAFALPAATTQAFAAESCAKAGGPDMPPPPGMGDGPGMMPPPPHMDAGPGDVRHGPPPPECGPGDGLPPHLRGLDLSAAQRERIAGIYRTLFENLHDRGAEAAKAHDALRDLAMSEAYDEARAKTLADAAATTMAQLDLEHARADQTVFQLLTPEQRARLKERMNHPRPDMRPPARSMPEGMRDPFPVRDR